MKVRELIEKLQALEDQDMEVVAIDHEYGAYIVDDPEIREEYSRGYDTVKVVVLDDGTSRYLWDIDPKYITKGEAPKRLSSPLIADSILREVFMSRLVPRDSVFFIKKEDLLPDATHVEFKIHDDRKDQNMNPPVGTEVKTRSGNYPSIPHVKQTDGSWAPKYKDEE